MKIRCPIEVRQLVVFLTEKVGIAKVWKFKPKILGLTFGLDPFSLSWENFKTVSVLERHFEDLELFFLKLIK